ncbi:unnamed protein product [Macrosiphum euphorbiae]|uniref:Uncharacterized protein n=1 Tax=Macrosiphum euphorbiae TaxID=13131 RepID=A0AAV0WKX1_9HEMI|nr:unnamed protein product [Macrosiphum euphorbiae]
MPKVKTNAFLKKLVLEFGEEIFQTDGSIANFVKQKCHMKKNIIYNSMYGEKNMFKLLKDTKMKSLHYFNHFYNSLVRGSQSDFNADLCSILVAVNIPMNKLNNKHFRAKYMVINSFINLN